MNFPKRFKEFFAATVAAATPIKDTTDDEDVISNMIDPQEELREKCALTHRITLLYEKLMECNDRVNSKSKTMETCEEQLFDYIHAIDHCAANALFSRLK
ncbi:cytochrome b-c1 complex subunit 6, mitochondrial-like [Stomoxys calcitrans]|uniref:cytochrome b-c1 complex subunit 6, mitochondrial-like n=1 Tax=Stomoxys calcitrans TaxID=35570 RepID=UPI0027E2DD54|nr:cytochrome b-c1 complex subunit 6, mitochondrial-like [Stomoxys calcitrans]